METFGVSKWFLCNIVVSLLTIHTPIVRTEEWIARVTSAGDRLAGTSRYAEMFRVKYTRLVAIGFYELMRIRTELCDVLDEFICITVSIDIAFFFKELWHTTESYIELIVGICDTLIANDKIEFYIINTDLSLKKHPLTNEWNNLFIESF